MFIVRLIEEHILAVAALGGPLLKDAFLVDTVLGTQPLPIHGTHLQLKSGISTVITRNAHFDFHIDQAGLLRSLGASVERVQALVTKRHTASRVTISKSVKFYHHYGHIQHEP